MKYKDLKDLAKEIKFLLNNLPCDEKKAEDVINEIPVPLALAESLLLRFHPNFYFDAKTLQTMCIKQLVPHLEMPTCGLTRKVRYMVRVGDIVKHLKKKEKTA